MPDLRASAIPAGSLSGRGQPAVELDGLVLRPWRAEDSPLLVRAYSDPDIRRWHVRSMDDAEALAWIAERESNWREERAGDWLVLASGTPVGRVSVHSLDLRDGCGEVGYWVLPEARGRGIATRALTGFSRWLFEEAGLLRIELEHSTANPISCRVALKAGFAAEGVRRGAVPHADGRHDMHLHARLRGDPAGPVA